jgi:hypothetical protein
VPGLNRVPRLQLCKPRGTQDQTAFQVQPSSASTILSRMEAMASMASDDTTSTSRNTTSHAPTNTSSFSSPTAAPTHASTTFTSYPNRIPSPSYTNFQKEGGSKKWAGVTKEENKLSSIFDNPSRPRLLPSFTIIIFFPYSLFLSLSLSILI